MNDDLRRELEALARRYVERCPDSLSRDEIEHYAATHRKMALRFCGSCGEECRQFQWLLDETPKCFLCRQFGGPPL